MLSSVSSPVKYKFSLNLKRFRALLGLSQEQLARKIYKNSGINVTRSAIAQWENGSFKPHLDTFLALCTALGITPNELLDFTGVAGSSGDLAGEGSSNGLSP